MRTWIVFALLLTGLGMAEERKATFAGGCYWCTEAYFEELQGVSKVTAGFIGGNDDNPSYEELASGVLGHAEAVEIVYDPEQITYSELLEVHFETHDPTSVDRQGEDVGPQYRSGVYYHDEEQKRSIEEILQALRDEKVYDEPIVTEIAPAGVFYPAKESHQDYYGRQADQQYCDLIITPKVEKFRKIFADKLKPQD